MKTLVLGRKSIEKLIGMDEAIRSVEGAFREYGLKRVQMPAKIYLHIDKYSGDFRAMPAYIEKIDTAAVKWVNVHPRNRLFGLPAVMAVVILSDLKTGFPLCIMDGTYLTGLRTGAAGAVAAKYLARKDSRVVGLVGCGVQAKAQLEALSRLFEIKEVRVWGYEKACVGGFIRRARGFNINFKASETVEECVCGSDIVVTTTPSRKPLVKLEWLKKGAHVNAIGADARGKQELDPDILKEAKVVVDAWEQASHSGEINVPLRKGLISRKDIYADIGEVVAGIKKGRVLKEDLTVFDSTGLAIQDAAVADFIYKAAVKKKAGRLLKII